MSDHPMFIYLATYADYAGANDDFRDLLDLRKEKLVDIYDVALVNKTADGTIQVEKHEKPTRHGLWGGVAVGAAVGILAAPAVVPAALIGGAIGGLGAHFRRGIPRDAAKELGDLIDAGQATLLVIGGSRIADQLDGALTRAEKSIEKEIDLDRNEFKRELDEAEKQLAAS